MTSEKLEQTVFDGKDFGAGDAGFALDNYEEDKLHSVEDFLDSEYLAALDQLSSGDESFESDFDEDEGELDVAGSGQIDFKNLPFPERLSIRRTTTLSRIRDAATKNSKSAQFNNNRLMSVPLESKVPALPLLSKGLVYTRGNIGENLLRSTKSYITEDPLNQEKVLGGPYNALHDPCAKNYFANPSVRKLLVKQGLLTETGQVVCNLTEFNNFRRYMNKAVYNEEVKSYLKKYDKQRELHLEQGQKLGVPGLSRPSPNHDERIEKAKELAQRKKIESMEKFKESQEIKEERIKRCQLELERQRLNRILKAEAKDRIRLKKLARQKAFEMYYREQKIHFIEAKEKAGIVKKNIEIAKKEQETIEYLEKRIQVLEERESKRQQMERQLHEELQRNAELRQKQFENHRAKLAYRIKHEKDKPKPNVHELQNKYIKNWNNYNKKKQSQKGIYGPSASLSRTATSMQKLILDLKTHIIEPGSTDTDEFTSEGNQD